MKALIQRVSVGAVSVAGEELARIGRGYVVLLGVRRDDTEEDAVWLARKTAALRIFPDDQDRMHLDLIQVQGSALVIPQFTLHADTRRGNRPGFEIAAPPEIARWLYDKYVQALREIMGAERVFTGQFQAKMTVEIINDGPVTIELRSRSELFETGNLKLETGKTCPVG